MIDVTVLSRNDEALGICSFELTRPDGQPLPPFTAGAHIDVHLPDGLIRQYSLCNAPNEHHRYLIGVLNDPASRGGSRALHEQIKPGAQLRISEPRNLFPLAENSRRTLLFGGGIGITPILCMAEQLTLEGADFELHYCIRSAERGAFIKRLRQSPFAERVTLHLDEQPDTALDASRVLANPDARRTCTCAARVVSCNTSSTARGLPAGPRTICIVSIFPPSRWTPATTAVFQ